MGLCAFEETKAVATPHVPGVTQVAGVETKHQSDVVVVVPAQEDGFSDVFLKENCWYAIRISGGMLQKIKYIAAYQTKSVSAVTHYAPVAAIEHYGEEGKYRLVFSELAKPHRSDPLCRRRPGPDARPSLHHAREAARRQKAI